MRQTKREKKLLKKERDRERLNISRRKGIKNDVDISIISQSPQLDLSHEVDKKVENLNNVDKNQVNCESTFDEPEHDLDLEHHDITKPKTFDYQHKHPENMQNNQVDLDSDVNEITLSQAFNLSIQEPSQQEKLITLNNTHVDHGLIQIYDTERQHTLFKPIDYPWQLDKCLKFGLSWQAFLFKPSINLVPVQIAGSPKVVLYTGGHGDCFFRAISTHITGTEDQHGPVRQKICDFIETSEYSEAICNALIGRVDPRTYIRQSQMRLHGWATQVEIAACAIMLQTKICTFLTQSNGRQEWHTFDPRILLSNQNFPVDESSIYLNHKDGNHYESVYQVHGEIVYPPVRPICARTLSDLHALSDENNTNGLDANKISIMLMLAYTSIRCQKVILYW